MKKRNSISAALAAALVITSSSASADSNLGAFAVGAAVGALVNSQVNKNRQQQQRQQQQQAAPRQSTGISSYQRQQNREVQSALNNFGFEAGAVDGQLGRRSRAAIANYQSYMGYQPTGYLEDYQRGNLVSANQRLQAGGGAAYPEVVANEGTRGLLKAFQDPNYANRYRQNNAGVQSAGYQGQDNNQQGFNSVPLGTQPDQPPASFAPLDLSLGQAPTSMASHCDLVAGITEANQGRVLPNQVADPEQALGEQFCEARTYAITQSQSLLSAARQTETQLATACGQIADAMAPATNQIGTQDVKLVATSAQQISNGLFNNDTNTASAYGQICLGLGYRQDDARMALGGATVLLSTGQMPYAEVMGHHLRWGFGTTRSPGASNGWYMTALDAMEQGAAPVFVPSKSVERNAIIQASVTGTPVPQQAASNNGLTLPALNLDNN